MVARGIRRAAMQRGNAGDGERIRGFLYLSAQRTDERRRCCEPVRLLQPQAGGVFDVRLALGQRGQDRDGRDEVRRQP